MTSWQDVTFGLGGFFFAASLLPTIRSKTAEVPFWSSVPTALILGLYVVAEWTIHLHLAAIAGVFSAGAWGLVAALRHPRRKHEEIGPIEAVHRQWTPTSARAFKDMARLDREIEHEKRTGRQ